VINILPYSFTLANSEACKIKQENITTIGKQCNKTLCLRTTIPAGVVSQLKLKAGDKIEWLLKPDDDKLKIEVVLLRNNE
jgi:hypothetical protein